MMDVARLEGNLFFGRGRGSCVPLNLIPISSNGMSIQSAIWRQEGRAAVCTGAIEKGRVDGRAGANYSKGMGG